MIQLEQSTQSVPVEASENWTSKVAREVNVVGGGALTGIGNGVTESVLHPLELGANLATSAAFMLAMRGPGWIKAPAVAISIIGSLDFGKHAIGQVSNALPAIQDLWSSDKTVKSDRAVIEQNLGPLAFNVAGMAMTGLAAGYVGGRMASTDLAYRSREATQFSPSTRVFALGKDSLKTAGGVGKAGFKATKIDPLSEHGLQAINRELDIKPELQSTEKLQPPQFHSAPVTDDSWHEIFESQFPAEERQPYDFLHSLAADGSIPQVKLQLTRAGGKTVAFSITSDYGDLGGEHGRGLLLPYIGVDGRLQGQGIGGDHLEQMFAEAKANYPTAKGMVIEVEDPHAPGISAQDVAKRQQRIDWYEKHSSRVLDKPYLIPSADEGGAPLPGRLIWRDFDRGGLTDEGLNALIGKIYQHGYELPADHPIVQQVLAS